MCSRVSEQEKIAYVELLITLRQRVIKLLELVSVFEKVNPK